jgi:hypothetical protein
MQALIGRPCVSLGDGAAVLNAVVFGQFRHHHGAGAAVAFGAAFFGAAAMGVLAQPLQHGGGDGQTRNFGQLAAVDKADGLGGHRHFSALGAAGRRG